MEAKQASNLRVLVFPWLGHGHVFPFLELAKRLSKRNFQIYFLSTAINLDSVKTNLNQDSLHKDDVSIELVELHLPSLPDLPPQYHTTKNVPPHLMPTLMQAFQMSGPIFSDIIENLKPDLLIYDALQPWAAKLASKHDILSIHFATSGATTLSFFHHLNTYKTHDSFPYPAIYLRDYEKMDLIAQGESIKVKDSNQDNFLNEVFQLSLDIILIKSCEGLEGKYINYFSDLCPKKILPVGPLITHNDHQENNSDVTKWLSHQKNKSSTLYISFGSKNYLSKEQMQEIAKGLEISGVDFIWAVRFPIGSGISIKQALPEGFVERVKRRGIVVEGWMSQTRILAHPSVGGFMSHCGWSSITEGIYFVVPIVGLPLKLDQPVNCRFVVEAGVGVEVLRDVNGWFNGESVANAIKKVIVDKFGDGLRKRARELSEMMKREEEEEALDQVAKQISNICVKNKQK